MLTASKGYTVSMEQESPIDFNSLRDSIKTKMPLNNRIVLIRMKNINKCRIFVMNNERYIDNHVVHAFMPHERKMTYDAFLTELCLTYELPLNGYITSSAPYDHIIKNVTKEKIDEHTILMFNCIGDIKLKFPFYVCNFYTNSSPVLLDGIQFEQYCDNDDMLITSLSSLFSLLLVELPHVI